MTHTIKITIALLLVMPLLFSCQPSTHKPKELSLNGAWALKTMVSIDGHKFDYPNEEHVTLLRIYQSDSCMYECKWAVSSSGNVIIPNDILTVTIVNKGNHEILYLENGHPRPLTVVNDTTIVIQEMGAKYTWVKNSTLPPRRIDEIRNVIANYKESDESPNRFIFSTAEGELETENNYLTYFIAGIMGVLVLIGYFAVRTYRNKKHLESMLKQISDERENRPQQVTNALKDVEDEFLHSSYYITLCNRISAQKPFSKDEWEEIAGSLNRVYPGFTNRLFNLSRMSEIESHVCLLIKLRVPPKDMATLLCKSSSTISSIRSRLYSKVFGHDGGAKEWDDFILSL